MSLLVVLALWPVMGIELLGWVRACHWAVGSCELVGGVAVAGYGVGREQQDLVTLA